MTTAVEPIVVTEPGLFDMPDDVYHRDPVPGGSLSSTGARHLLPPSCPAKYRHYADNPPTPKPAYDIGHGAHRLALGAGPDIVVVDAPDWRTKAAQKQRAEAHAAGKVPLLAHVHEQIKDMAAALRKHKDAAPLLHPATGVAEQSAFWRDPQTGIWCRARYDWLRNKATGQLIIVDYKTTTLAELDAIQRTVNAYGYYMQADFYLTGAQVLGLGERPTFVFIFQEKEPPYLVTVVQLDMPALQIGRQRNREAIEIYRRCKAANEWPGYTNQIELISLPAWVVARHQGTAW